MDVHYDRQTNLRNMQPVMLEDFDVKSLALPPTKEAWEEISWSFWEIQLMISAFDSTETEYLAFQFENCILVRIIWNGGFNLISNEKSSNHYIHCNFHFCQCFSHNLKSWCLNNSNLHFFKRNVPPSSLLSMPEKVFVVIATETGWSTIPSQLQWGPS